MIDTLLPYLPALALALSIQAAGIIAPGPSVALILAQATGRGRGAAILTAAGIACGSGVLAAATVFGITSLLAQMAELMTLIRLIGALYLAFLAYKAFRRALDPPELELSAQSTSRAFLSGFILQSSNPKAILFWLAIAATGGIGAAPAPIVVLFVALAVTNSFIGHGAYALLLSAAPVRRAYASGQRWVDCALGGLFSAFALRLAFDRS
ncbi:MAG: LysE family transporter [Pseudomonadota bacterium]